MFKVSCNCIYHAEIWPLVTFELNPKFLLKSILIFLNSPFNSTFKYNSNNPENCLKKHPLKNPLNFPPYLP